MISRNIALSKEEVCLAVNDFLRSQSLPKEVVPAAQVVTYLKEVFLGASELPFDIKELDLRAVRKAHLQGYQNRIFGTPGAKIPPAYRVAYEAWQDHPG